MIILKKSRCYQYTGPDSTDYFIVYDYESGHKNRYTLTMVPLENHEVEVLGREITLGRARALIWDRICDRVLDGLGTI